MMAGRDSLQGSALWRWADEGEKWLANQFKDKGLEFHTVVDVDKREVKLTVFREKKSSKVRRQNVAPTEVVFEVTEPAENFVSHLTVTKIILIAG